MPCLKEKHNSLINTDRITRKRPINQKYICLLFVSLHYYLRVGTVNKTLILMIIMNWLKGLATKLNDPTNQNSKIVPKVRSSKKNNVVIKLCIPVKFTDQCSLSPCLARYSSVLYSSLALNL